MNVLEKIPEQLVKYIQKYYPEIIINNDFQFQEITRIITSAKFSEDSKGGHNGWLSMKIILNLIAQPLDITPEFRKFINDSTLTVKNEDLSNVRGIIKKIWMYPNTEYPEWIHLSDDLGIIPYANKIIQMIKPKLGIINGKIYVLMDGFVRKLAEKFNFDKLIPDVINMVPNFGTDHITVINSDVLMDCLKSKPIDDLLEKYNKALFNITFDGIKHTVSLDWPKFSICVVLSLSSNHLNNFLKEFNERYNMNVHPSTHITIACVMR